MHKALLLSLMVLTSPLHAQVISTIAGPGNQVYKCDDTGYELLAMLTNPIGIAVDDPGNVYIAQYWDAGELLGSIIKLKPNGFLTKIKAEITKENGGDIPPPLSNHLSYPHGIATDHSGNIYIAEYNSHIVRKVTPAGKIIAVAGCGAVGYSGDKGPATLARLSLPNGVATDYSGNIYIADEYNHAIRKVTPDGIITTYAGTGAQGYRGDGGPATRAQLNMPYGIATDNAGNVYFADSHNNVVRKVNRDGIISTIAGNGAAGYGGDGGQATDAQLNEPAGIAADALGNLYVADEKNNVIRKVAVNGTITTVAGNGRKGYNGDGGPATAAELSGPRDVATDVGGNVYIADFGNHVIRKVTIKPHKDTVAPPVPEIIELPPQKAATPPPHNDEDNVTVSVSEDNILTIQSSKGSYTSFTITNMAGEKVMKQSIKAKEINVDVKTLPPGFYDISLKSDKNTKTLRFVKEN